MTRKEAACEMLELRRLIGNRVTRHMENVGSRNKPILKMERQIEAITYCVSQLERIAAESTPKIDRPDYRLDCGHIAKGFNMGDGKYFCYDCAARANEAAK